MLRVQTLLALIIAHVKKGLLEMDVRVQVQLFSLLSDNLHESKIEITEIFMFDFTCSPDIDECSNGSHVCDVNANCTNTVGSHNCTCKEGFTGNGRSCSGTVKFTLLSHKATDNQRSINFKSLCRLFFIDIDECSNGSHVCDVNANCTNTVGSHNCTCKEGFTGNGRSCSGTLNLPVFHIKVHLTPINFFWLR